MAKLFLGKTFKPANSAYFVDVQERLGGRDDPRLVPLLACIIELLPWLKQWHHDIDPDYNQRMMALTLQESGIGRAEWLKWVQAVPGFAAIPPEQIEQLVTSMLQREILWEEAWILAMGREGESTYGRKNFLELFSVFMSPPLFSIRHGRQELGYVDEMTFLGKHEGPRALLLTRRSSSTRDIRTRPSCRT